MTTHMPVEYFDEPLRGSFIKSLVLHGLVLGGIAGYVLWKPPVEQFGEENAGGATVAVTPVSSIPLPSRGQQNPLAADAKSTAPQAPPEKPAPKAAPKENAKAIPIPTERPTKTKEDIAAEQQKFRPLEPLPNQLTQQRAPALSDQMYKKSGSARVGTEMNTTLGSRFPAYAAIVRDRVAAAWRTADVDARLKTAPTAIVAFELLRNGTVRNVRLVQRSGITSLDFSVQRAVQDAAPFPELPREYNGDMVPVEFQFELSR